MSFLFGLGGLLGQLSACRVDSPRANADEPSAVTAGDPDGGSADAAHIRCDNRVCSAPAQCVATVDAALCRCPLGYARACTRGSVCLDGKCGGGSMLDCDDQNACTDDSCDETLGRHQLERSERTLAAESARRRRQHRLWWHGSQGRALARSRR